MRFTISFFLFFLFASMALAQDQQSKTLLPKNMSDVSDFNCHVEEKSHLDKATGQTITTWRARISVYRNGKKAEEIPVAFSRRRTRDDATKVCQELAALFSAEREKTR